MADEDLPAFPFGHAEPQADDFTEPGNYLVINIYIPEISDRAQICHILDLDKVVDGNYDWKFTRFELADLAERILAHE